MLSVGHGSILRRAGSAIQNLKNLAETSGDGTVSVRTEGKEARGPLDITKGAIVRLQICSLLILAAFFAAPAGAAAAEAPPKPGSCPLAIKPLPRNVTRAVDRIVRDMYPELRETLLKTKREELVQYQTDWGKGIRDSLCLQAGGNDQLLRAACHGELCHPEEASMVIMEAVWTRLQGVKKVMRPADAPKS
jgi:hypothetical protein